MKKLVIIMFFSLMYACGGEKDDSHGKVTVEFAMDTVLIDPGEEILFLNSGLRRSFLSSDGQFLYNFNEQEFALEKIDLNRLAYEEKTEFSKEGPHGVGDYLMQILEVNQDTLLFRNFDQENFMDWNAKKIKKIEFRKMGEERSRMKDTERILHIINPAGQSRFFYGVVGNWDEKSYDLLKFDLETGNCDRFHLPFFDRNNKYELVLRDGGSMYAMSSMRNIDYVGGKIIFSSNVFNDLYVLDPGTDSIYHKGYVCELTANEKIGNYVTEAPNAKGFGDTYKKINEEIGFQPLVWDADNGVYYRFSEKMVFGEDDLNEQRIFPSPTSAVVYITLFDKDLNKLNESLVPDLKKRPAKHFAKDGRIWIFENIDDEMGFVRLTVDY